MADNDNLPTTDLVVADSTTIAEMKAKMANMKEMIKMKRDFLRDNLTEGLHNDYAKIPGTPRNSLLKPGAEKLLDWHGYYPCFTMVASKEDFDMGLFAYVYRCEIKKKGSNVLVAQCEGDASNMEAKYRFEWRTAENLPAGMTIEGLPARNFGNDSDPYWKYQIAVENPADKRNTIRKMAQKRAFIGATVLATATSDLFDTKDPDDPDDATGTTGGTQNAHVKAGGDYKSLIKKRIKSQYGEADKKSKCNHCGEYHILKGQEVVGIDGPNNKLIFGAEPCLARKWQEEHPAAEPSEESNGMELRKLTPEDEKAADRVRIISKAVVEKGGTATSFQAFVENLSPLYQGDEFHIDRCDDATFEKIMQAWKEADLSTATVDKAQSAAIFAAITAAKKTVNNFMAFTVEFNGMYEGKGVKDILASDCDRLLAAWNKAAKEGAL